MNVIFRFLAVVMLLISCNKEDGSDFDHYADSEPVPCQLCSYAKSLEGTYSGIRRAEAFPGYHFNPNWESDTFYYHVEQVFLNQGNPVDSVVMYFKLKHKHLSQTNWSSETIMSITDSSGCLFERSCGGRNYMKLRPDYLKEYGSMQTSQSSYYNNLYYLGEK